jgi:phosphatidylserine/phosphatidylglycerophosphate/cardiolipin synthase-like enzyme
MKITQFAIDKLVSFITGDGYPPSKSGRELIALFNNYGARDVYDEFGLPDIGKRNGQRPSRKEYVKKRLEKLNNSPEMRDLLTFRFNELISETNIQKLNEILNSENFQVVQVGDKVLIQGGVIDRRKPVVNEAHFQDIQKRIIAAIENAKVSIRVVMAWFTNDTLFNKLLEKNYQGIDVKIAIYDDGVNKKYGVDLSQIPHTKIKRGKKGGLMHDKFCVIDNQVVITGSYNWTNNAETRNDENVTIQNDPEQATRYSEEYRRLITKKNY